MDHTNLITGLVILAAIPFLALLAGYIKGRNQDPSWAAYNPHKPFPDTNSWDVV